MQIYGYFGNSVGLHSNYSLVVLWFVPMVMCYGSYPSPSSSWRQELMMMMCYGQAFRNSESQSLRSSGHRFEEPEDSDVENNKQEHDLEREREQDVNSSGSDNEQVRFLIRWLCAV